MTTVDLSYDQLLEENRRLRLRVDAFEHAAEKGMHWFAQLEAQVELRIRCQNRLVTAARVLHEIELLYPHAIPVIDRARGVIWP